MTSWHGLQYSRIHFVHSSYRCLEGRDWIQRDISGYVASSSNGHWELLRQIVPYCNTNVLCADWRTQVAVAAGSRGVWGALPEGSTILPELRHALREDESMPWAGNYFESEVALFNDRLNDKVNKPLNYSLSHPAT